MQTFGFRIELRSDMCRTKGTSEPEQPVAALAKELLSAKPGYPAAFAERLLFQRPRYPRSPRGCYFRDHDTCVRQEVAISETLFR